MRSLQYILECFIQAISPYACVAVLAAIPSPIAAYHMLSWDPDTHNRRLDLCDVCVVAGRRRKPPKAARRRQQTRPAILVVLIGCSTRKPDTSWHAGSRPAGDGPVATPLLLEAFVPFDVHIFDAVHGSLESWAMQMALTARKFDGSCPTSRSPVSTSTR